MVDTNNKDKLSKALMYIYTYTGDKKFTFNHAVKVLLRNFRVYNEKSEYKKSEPKTRHMTLEEATRLVKELRENGYIDDLYKVYPRPNDPATKNLPPGGVMLLQTNKLRIIEASNTDWYKRKLNKAKATSVKPNSDIKLCKTFRMIYGIFGTRPFTYDLVIQFANNIIKNDTQHPNPKKDVTPRERDILREVMMDYSFDSRTFQNTWNSLIRNNYIVPYKRKLIGFDVNRFGNGTSKKEYIINKYYINTCFSSKNKYI